MDFETEGDTKRLEKLGECAVSAHVDFSTRSGGKCFLTGDEHLVYELTEPTYLASVTEHLCIERRIMVKLLEMQIAAIIEYTSEKIRIYEKYCEYELLALIIAEIPNFEFILNLQQTTLLKYPFRDKTGRTPLMEACERGCPFVSDIIATEFAQIEQVSRTGHTALIYACLRGYEPTIHKLIDSGKSNPEQVCKGGETAFMQLCKHKHIMLSTIRKLLATGKAKPGHVSHEGKTALIYACERCITSTILELFGRKDCKPNHRIPSSKKNAFSIVTAQKQYFPSLYYEMNKIRTLGK